MERRGKKIFLFAFGGIGLLVTGFLIISAIVRQSLAPLPDPTEPPPITEAVVVTRRDIQIGAVLQASDLTTINMPIELVPREALLDSEIAVGRISKISLIAGEMVMQHHLADPTNVTRDLAFVLEEDQVLMAFPATDLMSQIDVLKPGDKVNILVSLAQPVYRQQGPNGSQAAYIENPDANSNEKPEEVLFTFDALQNVQISAVVVEVVQTRTNSGNNAAAIGANANATPAPTATPSPSQIEPIAVLLVLSQQDALVLKHIKDAGGIIDIVLRSPTSTQIFPSQPVMSEYLIDRYILELTR